MHGAGSGRSRSSIRCTTSRCWIASPAAWIMPGPCWDLGSDFAALRRRLEAQREDGTREYIRVLLLMRDYPPARVLIAVRHALRWTAPTSDAIKQLLIPSERPELKTFHLAGREHLAGVTVATTDLGSYGRLREVAHV